MSPDNVDISPKMDGGVLKRILTPGQGIAKPNPGSTVKVHYVGTLENGDKFDASKDKFEFVIGRGQVIKGWDIGIATMTKGEKAVFTIRSDYAYGDAGSPPKIPSGATLIFEKDGSIVRTSIVEGTKGSNPNDTSEVTAHIVGTFEGREFYNRDVNFVIGEGSEIGLPEGVDRALRRFLLGEKSKIELRGSRFTYGANPPPEYNLPVNATVEFTIFLKHFEKVPPTWEMTSEQKMANAKAVKERGTYFFQQGKLKLAWNKYKRMEDILEYEKSVDPEQRKERDELLISAFLNLSLTASKLNEHLDCITYCDKVLELQSANVKALYRKATAKLAMSDVEDAIKIYENVTQLEPSNKAAAQQILVCKAKLREQNVKDKKRYKNMFANLNEEPKSENKCGESCEEKETKMVVDDQIPTTSSDAQSVA